MIDMTRMFDVYLITDAAPDAAHGCIERTEAALAAAPAGRVAVQLRAKGWPPADRLSLGRALRLVTRRAGALLLVNGDLALAQQLAADGVQLPERGPSVAETRKSLGEQAWIGRSCHDVAGLAEATRQGASFATLSPFADSPGKGTAMGPQRFATCVRATSFPVFALGGLSPFNAGTAVGCGARGVAVIRAVYGAYDPADAMRRILAAMDDARREP